MAQAFSLDLRRRVIEAIETGLSTRAAARRFSIGISTAGSWYRQWRSMVDVNLRGPIHVIETFLPPMIATNVAEDSRLMREEQFCPLLPIVTYKNLDDAIARANDTIYGLGGSVWSKNVDAALDVARRIEAGSVFVNTHGTESVNRRAPYGGVKQSGIGRRAGIEGVREYMQIQTLTTFE